MFSAARFSKGRHILGVYYAAQEEIAQRKLYYSVGEFSASLNEKVKLIEES